MTILLNGLSRLTCREDSCFLNIFSKHSFQWYQSLGGSVILVVWRASLITILLNGLSRRGNCCSSCCSDISCLFFSGLSCLEELLFLKDS